MPERWFFALWPDRTAREGLEAATSELIPPGARHTHPLDWHLTLVFLGPLTGDALDMATAAVDGLSSPPIAIRLDRAGWFPRARVLWCGPSQPSPALLNLQVALDRALREAGLTTEDRPYRPHLTIARKVGHAPPRALLQPVEWTARELALARGVQGRVPRYAVSRRWPLGAPADASPRL